MWRRRASQSESTLPSSNSAYAYPFSAGQSSTQMPPRRGPIVGPYGQRLTRRVTWRSSTYKIIAYLYVLGILYIVWLIRDLFFLPFSSSSSPSGEEMPNVPSPKDYLAHFKGRQECAISGVLFNPLGGQEQGPGTMDCQNRTALLDALSNGGRAAVDAPYTPRGCHYHWYHPDQICQILRRFDQVVLLGDQGMHDIYSAFNILLRQDLAHGALRAWDMGSEQLTACSCDNQFHFDSCSHYRLRSSADYPVNPKVCSDPAAHRFLMVGTSPAVVNFHKVFSGRSSKTTASKKPSPVIHSVGVDSQSASLMDEWLHRVQRSELDVPFLWVGPAAASDSTESMEMPAAHILWSSTTDMIEAARHRGLDALGMYNATLHAPRWGDSRFGEETLLVQAMMIINWLAYLDI